VRSLRYIRRLPPLLRVVSIVGLLLPLASLVLLMLGFLSRLSRDWGVDHVLAVALNLTMLGVSCFFAVDAYSVRFRRPDRGPVPLDSRQSQL
jgi:hypothetical protein